MLIAAAAMAATLGMPGVARAEEYPENAGWGVLAVFANVVYMPVKTVYAVLGGISGGLAYACTGGNYETASSVWEMSLGGTYVLTPSMVRGDDPIYFAGGPSSTATTTSNAAAEAPVDEVQSNRGRHEESLPAS